MSQNLLSNVFKPTYVYDTVAQTYSSRLELVNIDTVSANTVSAFTAAIGDAFGNVYVGINAGNSYSNTLSNSNVTALGVNAGQGSSNSSNSVFIGYGAGVGSLNAINTIAIGANSIGSGTGNIYLGAGTGSTSGTSNIFIGRGVAPLGIVSNTLLVGHGSNYAITANLGLEPPLVGIGLSSPEYTLDVNGYARVGSTQNGGLGINTNPYDYTLNVNGDMQVTDGYGVFRFTHDANSNSVTTIAPTTTYANAEATLSVTGGFFSTRGIAAPTPTDPLIIGTLKAGMVMITVTTTGEGVSQARLFLANTPTDYLDFRSRGDDIINIDGSGNINISNADYVMLWTITYFPSSPF